jgi:hypothetical protein
MTLLLNSLSPVSVIFVTKVVFEKGILILQSMSYAPPLKNLKQKYILVIFRALTGALVWPLTMASSMN